MEQCTDTEQKQKIEEMNEIVDGMNEEVFESIFREETFDKIEKMIEEKKISMENAILLLKHVGFCKVLKSVSNPCFFASSLRGRFEQMIIEEEKKEEKDKTLLVDLCECYFLLNRWASSNLFPVCVPCLLKVSLNKEKNEEAQKKVEMGLLALSNIGQFQEMKRELYLNEIREIIEHQQKHRNLTHLAYQSAWQFFIYRWEKDKSLEKVIVNELHFVEEAMRELKELMKCVDWKKKEEEMSKDEANEVLSGQKRNTEEEEVEEEEEEEEDERSEEREEEEEEEDEEEEEEGEREEEERVGEEEEGRRRERKR
ncbi:uncharacterized protein MONOS_14187 [Monocercomonoides exilis]|uniref:uncharacterized protein n=1 Tax=Monocercomonoides exilis TaxID=2049356 RepID=UPI0035595A4C|nr:hypothetical protein MONOS_14187 [Monocercomonoides exilis]|eukprot:MONOS_14187.1-p1 / transcript=MONOS_14187.1 / gene=MONOS_14187 / organism=Monocercomonoides_exilis_PA203 / gene_product=unspecified product / transcript_product=unspecified product / location=Mono_scaffold00952:9924-11496(-) / protein_length=312 / sequence_SO=supercontig / SO=protein_coding / is_pseudo=false